MKKIDLIITDFDGTLVDTFYANYNAYKDAFTLCGLKLSEDLYTKCFGLRFDAFMDRADILDNDIRNKIKEEKKNIYPKYFNKLVLNENLINFIKSAKESGIMTAVASTASKENLVNVLNYFKIIDIFDYIFTGEDVCKGKPNPEIYLNIIEKTNIKEENTLIFEDSEVGMEAAERAKISYIKVNKNFYGNRS